MPDQSRFLLSLAAVLAAIAAVQVALGLVSNLLMLAVAVPFAASAYLIWYHASGRMARNVRRQARRRARTAGGARNRRRARRPNPPERSRADAYRTLGLSPGASEAAVRRAYREKVKEVHPDSGGNEQAFKRVADAYERLQA